VFCDTGINLILKHFYNMYCIFVFDQINAASVSVSRKDFF